MGQNLGDWIGLPGLSSALLFFVILLITYLVMVLPQRGLALPERASLRRWIASAAIGVLLLVGGRLLMPQMSAFDYYARGSNLFFVGLYEEALEDLNLALEQKPDDHVRNLILARLQHVSMVGKIPLARALKQVPQSK